MTLHQKIYCLNANNHGHQTRGDIIMSNTCGMWPKNTP